MLKYIRSFFYTEEKPTININSLSPLPSNRFMNYASCRLPDNDDPVPHDTIYHLKRMERLYGKSQKRKKQFSSYYDYFNH